MKIGGLMVYASVCVVGIILLLSYVFLHRKDPREQ